MGFTGVCSVCVCVSLAQIIRSVIGETVYRLHFCKLLRNRHAVLYWIGYVYQFENIIQ